MEARTPNWSKAKDSPYHRAVQSFPGNLIVDHWKESRALAAEDIQTIYGNTEEASNLLAELNSKVTAGTYIPYVLRKYVDASWTN